MKKIPHNLNHPTLIFLLGFLIIIFLVGSIYLILMYQEFKLTSDNENTNTSKVAVVEDIDTTDWKPAPYFSEDVNFVTYYPGDWEIVTINDSRSLYEGQSLVWFGDNSDYSVGTNTMGVYYYNDTGDTFDAWTTKRKEVLKGEHGYEAEVKSLKKDNEDFVQICFLGHPDYSHTQKCHIFFHRDPYIYELRVESYDKTWPAEKYMDEFFSKFSLFSKDKEGWIQQDSFNGGYSLMYPESYISGLFSDNFRMNFGDTTVDNFQVYEGENMNFTIATSYSKGAIQYWYDRNKDYTDRNYKIPKEIVVDNALCIYAEPRLLDEVSNYYSTADVYCNIGSRIYAFQIMPNNVGIVDPIFLEIVSTVRFKDDFIKNETTNIYKNEDLGFSFDYLNSLIIYNNSWDYFDDNWVGLDVETGDHLYWKHFGVGYEETTLTIEECTNDESCILGYEDFSEYSKIKYLGLNAYELVRKGELYDDIKTIERIILLKKDNYIMRIRSVVDKDGDNSEIDDILNSFEFL